MAKLIGADWVVYQDLNDLVGLAFRGLRDFTGVQRV